MSNKSENCDNYLLPWRDESGGQYARFYFCRPPFCAAVILPCRDGGGYRYSVKIRDGWTEWKFCQSLTGAKKQADAELVIGDFVLIKEELLCMI